MSAIGSPERWRNPQEAAIRRLRTKDLFSASILVVAAVAHAGGQTVASAGTFPGTNGKIAFAASGHINLIQGDGTGRVTLNAASPASSVNEPAWNKAGTKLVFRDGGSSLSTMSADGSKVKRLVGMDSFVGNPTWSPDGSVIAFDHYIGGFNQENRIYTVPAAGGTATVLAPLDAQDPTYSPDGTKIAYEESAGDSDIGVMNADGSGAMNITSGTGGNNSDFDPSWSPDGAKIAFTRARQIWTMNADGSSATQLTTGADAGHPTWSPDGTKIAFSRDDDIWVMDSDGSDATNITNTPIAENREPDWGAVPPPPEARVYIGWIDDTTGTANPYIATSIDGGATFTPGINVTGTTKGGGSTSTSTELRIAARKDYLYAAWIDGKNGNTDVRFARSDDDGVTFSRRRNLSDRAGPASGLQLSVFGKAVYLAWTEDEDVFFRRSIDQGETWEPLRTLNGGVSASHDPRLAVSGNSVYVVWTGNKAGRGDIWLRRSLDKGKRFKSKKNLSRSTGHSGASQLAVVGTVVHVAWTDQACPDYECSSTTPQGLFYKRGEDRGASFGGALRASALGPNYPHMAASGSNVYLAWQDFAYYPEYNVFFDVSTNGGQDFGDSRIVTLSESPDSKAGGTLPLSGIDLAGASSHIHVVWEGGSFGNLEIWYRGSSESGSTFGSIRNLSGSSVHSRNPRVAVTRSGSEESGVYVVWQDGEPGDIQFRYSLTSGAGFNARINISDTAGNSIDPQIAVVAPPSSTPR